MKNLNIKINTCTDLYSKDPESSVLGIQIISKSIEIINNIGFESFNFKKLGDSIGSNESSVYRYFPNKHALLIYLVNWYWSWMDYKIVLKTANINDPKEKLKLSVELLAEDIKKDSDFSFIDEIQLNKIIITESSKAYHNIDIDKENEKGFFKAYKKVVERVSSFIVEYNPNYEFPHMLVSTIIEGAHNQRFFADHLPSLTDFQKGKNNIVRFYTNLVFCSI